jgi:very-short-patch-repair endonuclease
VDIDEVVAAGQGVLSRNDAVRLLGRHRFDNAVKSGRLAAVFPRAYAHPWDVDTPVVRKRAALVSVGGQVAFSHLTALELHGLHVPAGPLHVTAYQTRHPRGVPDELVVHRTLCPLEPTQLDGFDTVHLETALATGWPLLPQESRRAPLIEAYRRRMLSAVRLHRAVESAWWVADLRTLRRTAELVLDGCESELELWGYTEVFDAPGLRDAVRQKVVRVGDATVRLDMAYEDEMLDVELDGRAFHASPEQWSRDIARDLLLAKLGWQTIRLSHRRLVDDVAGCRRDVVAVRAARGLRGRGVLAS